MKNPNAALAVLINLRNLMQLFVCADRRYGPTYNMGTAREIHRSLVRHGHRPGSPDEVILLGWGGGGQVALGAAWYLHAMGLRTSVLSLGSMLSDDIALARVEHLWHLYGTRDFLQASGKLLFAGRWPVSKASPWNEALRDGGISMIELGPYNPQHQGALLRLRVDPAGRTQLRRQGVGHHRRDPAAGLPGLNGAGSVTTGRHPVGQAPTQAQQHRSGALSRPARHQARHEIPASAGMTRPRPRHPRPDPVSPAPSHARDPASAGMTRRPRHPGPRPGISAPARSADQWMVSRRRRS